MKYKNLLNLLFGSALLLIACNNDKIDPIYLSFTCENEIVDYAMVTNHVKDTLATLEISKYEIVTKNERSFDLIIKDPSVDSSSRRLISLCLTYSNGFTLSNAHDKYLFPAIDQNQEAFASDDYYVVVPISSQGNTFYEMLEQTREDIAFDRGDYGEEWGWSEEDTLYKYYLYLWMNYDQESCSFDNYKYGETSNDLLAKFEVTLDDAMFYKGFKNHLYFYTLIDRDDDGYISDKEKARAAFNVNAYTLLFNKKENNIKLIEK